MVVRSRSRRWETRISQSVIVALAIGSVLAGGCARRTAVEDEVAVAQRPVAPAPADPHVRQGIGAPQPAWMDDPATRRGPQGQPAPYGRDTITGKPLSELQSPGVSAPSAPSAVQAGQGSRIVVGKGETLSSIARRHKVSVDSLRIANELRSDRIMSGQTLIIPGR